jgi:hypothetical protein
VWASYINHLEHGNRLAKPLGKWLTPPHRQWSLFYQPDTNLVYQLQGDSWMAIHPEPQTRPTRRVFIREA